ncbi:MAG TPA: hypothetical protein VL282_08430 [Tepidisphaeraceae bacterium]|nr:hypothetical protein [Tepidisphaeraceae bacterium]
MYRFFSTPALAAVMMAMALAGCGAARNGYSDYTAISTNQARPENERALDAIRKPDQVMAFYGVKEGDKVADLFAARGYYTAILSQLVGSNGVVYSVNPAPRQELHDRVKQANLSNVRVIDGPLDKMALPQFLLDFVLIHLDYHEVAPDIRNPMNKRVFAALKRGGSYGVVDHSAAPGRGDQDIKTLHRIEKSFVIKDVTSAGFKLDSEGTMLSRADDSRDFSVTQVRDRSDRFVLKFIKP